MNSDNEYIRAKKYYDNADYKNALIILRQIYQYNGQACFLLGYMYSLGQGVMKNQKIAIRYFEYGDSLGNTDCMNNLGNYYNNSHSVTYLQKAFQYYQKAANKNHPFATYHLAEMYEQGRGTKVDYQLAITYYKKPISLGINQVRAYNRIGIIYQVYYKNYQTALKWYDEAAMRGYIYGKYNIATLYKYQLKSIDQAIKVFQMIIDELKNKIGINGLTQDEEIVYLDSQYELADIYLKGNKYGCEIKQKEGNELLNDCIRNGHYKSMYYVADSILQKYYFDNYNKTYSKKDTQDYQYAIRLYQILANKGESDAMYKLGLAYSKNIAGINKDDKASFTWFEKAAQKNHVNAIGRLGRCYYVGIYVEKDYKKAIELFNQAIQLGDAYAMYRLGLAYAFGCGVEKDLSKAGYWYERSYVAIEQSDSLFIDRIDLGTLYNNLGISYENSNGVQQSYENAFNLYLKADKLGSDYGCYNLGEMYYYGKYVKQDYAKAYNYFYKSAQHNHQFSIKMLQQMQKQGYGVKAVDDEDAVVLNLFEKVNKRIEKLEDFHLSNKDFNTINNYIKYRTNTHETIHYNMMLHGDNDRLEDFINIIQKEMNYKGITNKCHICDENYFVQNYQKILDEFKEYKYGMIVIMDCNEFDDQSQESKKAHRKYDNIWKDISYDINDSSLTFIICSPDNILKNRIMKDEVFYNHTFNHHMMIPNMDKDQIYHYLMMYIEDHQYTSTEHFNHHIKDYILNVYPNSSLKNKTFAETLYNDIVTNYIGNNYNDKVFHEDCIPAYHKTKSFEEATEQLNQLIGLTSVKEAFKDLSLLTKYCELDRKKNPLHMVFSGNPGTGKTTVARLAADILYSIGISEKSKVKIVFIGQYIGQTAPQTKKACEDAYGGILFIDEAYLIAPDKNQPSSSDKFKDECIGTLLQEMENNSDKLIVIFAGYTKEMENLIHSNPGMKSRIYKVIEFEDYTDDELTEIFKKLCIDDNYELNDEAIPLLKQFFASELLEEDFGNARVVRDTYQKVKQQALKHHPTQRCILPEDVIIQNKIKSYDDLVHELDSLIGINEAKTQIKKTIAIYQFFKEENMEISMYMNMLFLGRSGTGKTTVSKLFGQMLYSIGVIKTPKVISVKPYELNNSSFMNYCEKAKGGILVMEDAQLLLCNNAYITLLLDITEKYKNDLIIILSGQENEIISYLDSVSLKPRFPTTVLFDDFSIDELVQIFLKLCHDKHDGKFTISDDGIERLKEKLEILKNQQKFSNIHSVENLFEDTIRTHIFNLAQHPDKTDRYTIDAYDFD
ncbi:MAG: AAA family ATPase [Erysipelotrichaceae bacterium]|nr:AAA family ATPase [Erysipelotrichaceae bacterium]